MKWHIQGIVAAKVEASEAYSMWELCSCSKKNDRRKNGDNQFATIYWLVKPDFKQQGKLASSY